jgi:hypothetical protein
MLGALPHLNVGEEPWRMLEKKQEMCHMTTRPIQSMDQPGDGSAYTLNKRSFYDYKW